MCVRKPGGDDTLLRGLDHPVEVSIGKTGLSEVSGAGIKTGEFWEHLDTSGNREGEDQAGENGGSSSAANGHGMQPKEENVVVPKQFNLSGVLHSLMSLDPKGDFMGTLDGFSATNQSKVAEASTCFAMMQEKIRTQQYSTWRMFVEDFEWICYTALKWNQKRSIIWTAAIDLLRRGKKRLEQYERWGERMIALNKTGGSHANLDSKLGPPTKLKSENVGVRVSQHNKYPVTEGLKMAIPNATTGSPESKPPSSGAASLCRDAIVGKDTCSIQRPKEEKMEDQMTRDTTPSLAPVLDIVSEEILNVSIPARDVEGSHKVLEGELVNHPSAVRQAEEIVDIEGKGEIEGDVESGDYRGDLDGDATESSSSYESAGSALESDVDSDRLGSTFEAQSVLRDGNGAGGLMEDEDGMLANERGTKALDPDWKQSRRGIEWRCRWLELRTNLIEAKLSQYEKSLKSLQSAKIWKWEEEVGEGTSARTVPVKILRNHPVVYRKHRRRAEDVKDLDLGRHPVFSRYEKKKISRKSDDFTAQGKVNSQHVQQTGYESDEPEGTFEKVDVERQPVAGKALVQENSMESILFQLEALQARIKRTNHVLRKDAAASRSTLLSKPGMMPIVSPSTQEENASKAISRGGAPSPASVRAAGSGLARRRTSDYDINSLVMAQCAGTTPVDQVHHVDIETPQWRLIEDAKPLDPDSPSDEETSDEHYRQRHAALEVEEVQQRPAVPQKKNASGTPTIGKGRLIGKGKGSLKMRGSNVNLALPSMPESSATRSSDPIATRSSDPVVTRSSDTILSESVPKRQRTKNVRRPVGQAQARNLAAVVKLEAKSEVEVEAAEDSSAADEE